MLIGIVLALLTACQSTGPAGPPGADGADGANGANGADGADGADGNANVLQFEFGEVTFTNSLNLTLEVDRATIDNSLLLVYYNPTGESESAWYAAPGIGSVGAYQTRTFWFQTSTSPSRYTLAIRALKLDGSAYGSPLTFRAIRVIIAEASVVIPASIATMGYWEAVTELGLDPTSVVVIDDRPTGP